VASHRASLPHPAAGNALTDPATDSEGAVRFWWSHGIISTESLQAALDNCDFASIYPLAAEVGGVYFDSLNRGRWLAWLQRSLAAKVGGWAVHRPSTAHPCLRTLPAAHFAG